MNRLLILGCLCLLGQPLRGQDMASTNAAAPLRASHRFLFLIDTSSAMSRQKDVTLDSVSRLILSGVGGRIQRGDAWSLWTLDDQLHTDVFPAPAWDPQQRGDFANRIFRLLRDQRFKKKKMPLEKVMASVAEEAKFSGILTVFLFTDGSAPVNGTPFDEPINAIFAKHAAGMKKAKKPFVTVLVTQDGRFAGHAVSPGGERIYIPPLPEALAKAQKPEEPAREKAAPVVPPPPKTLTVDEISALLQSQKRPSNTVATAPAPLILRGNASQTNTVVATNGITVTNAVVADSSAKAAAETLARTTAASATVADATVSPDRSTVVSTPSPAVTPPGISLPAIAPSATPKVKPTAPEAVRAPTSTPVDSVSSSTSQPEQVSTPETEANEPRESPARSTGLAQTAVLARSDIAPIYLVTAVALLVVASLFAWLYIRSIRYVPRPSIISQSLDRQKK